jgi:pimeloyl-ACP methyl ester carboxylesterase
MQALNGVSFIQKGEGKDLLFLHGYLACKETFAAQIDYFSRLFRVTAVDFLGFGQSAKLTSAFDVQDYADWLAEVIEALGLIKPHVIAHSFGCRVAVKLAYARPNSVDKIVLTGAAGIIVNRTLLYHLKVGAYKLIKRIAPRFAERRFGSKEYRSLSPIMKESYKKIVNEDLREDASKIKNSTLIVEGKEDKTTPLAEAQVYIQNLQNGRLKIMQGGHFAFAEHPFVFNLIAEEFFI